MGKIYRVQQGTEIKYPVTIDKAVVVGNTTLDKKLAALQSLAETGGVTGIKGSAETEYRKGNVEITAANIGLGNVSNESKETMFTSTALTGTPTAPTAAAGTNTTQIATTAFVKSAINALDVTDTEVDGQYVSKVSETDGKISVTRKALPTPTDYSISVTKKATANSGAAASYTIAQTASGTSVDIDIPKDMVVSSGAVETKAAGAWGAAGTYLVLTLANATSDKVYINVGSLIEYVTSGSATTDKIQIAVNASTHKVTASIKTGSIEKTDLVSAVQTSLGKADTAVQSVAEGSANGTISVDGTDVSVHGLGGAAYKGVASSLSSTDTGLVTAKMVKDAGYTTNTGTITEVAAGTGLSGGATSGKATLSLATITKSDATGTAVTGTEGTTFTAVTGITYDTYGRVTGVQKTTLTNKNTTYTAATTSAAGLMSAADKTTLDALNEAALTWVQMSDEVIDDDAVAAVFAAAS